jgi:hypothetical protein
MSQETAPQSHPDIPPISKIDQERFALLDMRAQHAARLREIPIGGGMSMAEKAAHILTNKFADTVEGLTDEERAQYPPEDLQHRPFMFDDPSNTLEQVYMTQELQVDDKGNEHAIPVVSLDRPETPLPEHLVGSSTHISDGDDIPMATLAPDGTLVPEGNFTAGDIAAGQEMLGELAAAHEDGRLPHLRTTDMRRINDPAHADFYWQLDQMRRQGGDDSSY